MSLSTSRSGILIPAPPSFAFLFLFCRPFGASSTYKYKLLLVRIGSTVKAMLPVRTAQGNFKADVCSDHLPWS